MSNPGPAIQQINPSSYQSLGFAELTDDIRAFLKTGNNFSNAVNQSSLECLENYKDFAEIDDEMIKQYLKNMDWERFKSIESKADSWVESLPLKFPDQKSEINFIVLRDILQIGSGYRVELKESNGGKRGAADTILYGCLGSYISGISFDADSLIRSSIESVSEQFQIPLLGKEEPVTQIGSGSDSKPVASGIFTISKPSVLRKLAEQIVAILQDTGRTLKKLGYDTLADFIIASIEEQENFGTRPSAVKLADSLCREFYAFQDVYTFRNKPLYLFKKAQLAVYDLWLRFMKQDRAHFGFGDCDQLTIFADNVIPTMLIHYKLIKITSERLQNKLDNQQELDCEEVSVLRAASVVVALRIVDFCKADPTLVGGARSGLNQANLDQYWWQEGKEPELRKIPRISFKQTVYF
ncbi:hypothetical protein H4219_002454 [Mycoemilia scoparia]|uniref:Queuosine 5'-phosphate N-glycosylase/hydrolase n=1 Tax=Mycoemilia scoparia TaxID=417184 RepID=A0A9W8A3Y0_9FUNG|nr:hypothetical protein H4219_002454 [Mycoemilia scoparia]